VISLLSRVIAQATASSVIAGAISPVPRALTSVALRYGDPLHFNPRRVEKQKQKTISMAFITEPNIMFVR
jgi:hypothetical protein